MKLSKAQERVMKWIDGGWTLQQHSGMSIHVNGKRICNLDTIEALVKRGLIEKIGRYEWKRKDREVTRDDVMRPQSSEGGPDD